ncbi:MAG: single-stranded-DNA-specific exonuclease RecJ [candidate division WOR-3 bacterium]
MSAIFQNHQWQLPITEEERIQELVRTTNLPPIIIQLLYHRGCRTAEECREFINPSAARLHRPDTLPDINLATERIISAIKNQEAILVYGDYDVDGICGTAILVSTLKKLGGVVTYYLPHRQNEGYGISRAGIEHAIKHGIRLIITTDCGSADIENLKLARDAGIDVIVTDHHEPNTTSLPTLAFVNPKRPDSDYPFRELSGAGVAFKLAWQLLASLKSPKEELIALLDLVGMATIADVVPLVGENRIIARLGLLALSKTNRPGIKALLATSRLYSRKLSARDIAFVVAPRINAAGRVSHAQLALELLLTEDDDTAINLAYQLEEFNRFRQRLEDIIFTEARRLIIDGAKHEQRVLVLARPGWNEGVIGIVASKLAEEFWRPCILISLNAEIGKGSGRSISGFNLYEALEKTKDHLISFGGHCYAAGIKINRDLIPLFENAINQYASLLPESTFQPTLKIDAIANLDEITPELLQHLAQLQPFGLDNPEPVFASTGLEIVGYPQRIGRNKEHLKFKVRSGNTVVSVIAWNRSRDILNLRIGQPGYLDICYTLANGTFNSNNRVQLKLLDLRTAGNNNLSD